MNHPIVVKAKIYAFEKHKGQIDDEGKPYTMHLEQVVHLLCQVTQNPFLIAAGYLHDIIEDTTTTPDELALNFGKTIRDLVLEVTHEGTCDNKGYYFPRLHSKEGIMLKFADRLSNLSRMGAWAPERQAQYLRKSKFWSSE